MLGRCWHYLRISTEKKKPSTFGLLFGAMCAIPYFFVGLLDGGIVTGVRTAFAWWVAGIPWDITHAIGNFVLMMVLFIPVRTMMKKVKV